MSTSVQPASAGAGGGGGPSGLADVIDTILDKGLVIDAYVRVSLVGIEILTIDARVVVASVDTYLRFAEAANRLDMTKSEKGLPDVIADAKGVPSQDKAKDMIQGVVEEAGDSLGELTGKQRDPAAEAAESETEVEVDRAHQGPPKRKFRPKREEG
ncbi:gas vesicle protein GvpJ [Nonomuraea fuscirosea]|uniref:Gas vesicle protein A n=1 Tax=Nonomuraea fuscirosea TaxID=1291556 RepID=A0A2T0N6S9_9ACTN|nr:gas vesicle protein GvpJ [Nonomuraea fuscirosea]PRX68259.1 gas vesicle protein GvpA/GvpJ/GvpM family [Nonomuraea fuscirosea]WSA50400.1 gas vesicle structural protein GvpA [Nonomuraea fuscirosea]